MQKKSSMRFLLYILLLLYFFPSVSQAQRKRAFMVGISHYDTELTGYQWNNINGVEDINLLCPILKDQGFATTTVLDELGTYNNIVNQLSQFTNQTKRGDIVYLHFSTHGQPVEDINGDEEDGWDEAIVPFDAYKLYKKGVYEGGKHLTDDILNKYIKKLRTKIGQTGFLYVVIDACHAGTSSRDDNDGVRGTNIGFSSRNKVFKPSTSKKSHYRINYSSKQSNVLYLEACRSDQVNTEIKIGGRRYGPLSYNIAQVLNEFILTTNAKDFLVKIKRSLLIPGRWPNNQNLITETSY